MIKKTNMESNKYVSVKETIHKIKYLSIALDAVNLCTIFAIKYPNRQ